MSVVWKGPLVVPHFTPGRAGLTIDRIVLHTMVGWIGSADATFKSANGDTSAHFGVRIDGTLWQWVHLWDTAHHCEGTPGTAPYYDSSNNERSIGIEHEDVGASGAPEGGTPVVRPNELYLRSAQLVAQLCKENGIPCTRGAGGPGIYDHRQMSATACPGTLDTDRIIRTAQAILAASYVAP